MLLHLLLLAVAAANRVRFDSGSNRQVCDGMYLKHDWGGLIAPSINLSLDKFENKDVSVSFVIFEYRDIDHLGKSAGNGRRQYICTGAAVAAGLCTEAQKGHFLVNANVTNTTIMTAQLLKLGPANINYKVERTGYYCVATYAGHNKYKGSINFQNAFGHLSALEIPKLPAYGILTLCYVVALALYGFQFFKKRKQNQILPLQRYLLAILGFLAFDTLVVWLYYDLVNRLPRTTVFMHFYLVFLSTLNAAKVTMTFFLLLLIALGYGVVKLKLSKKLMLRCKLLAAVHFIALMFYLIATYEADWGSLLAYSDVDNGRANGSLLDIVPFIPVAITLTAYYLVILTNLRQTIAGLHQQRQVIKLQLYRNLFRIIFVLLALMILGLVLLSFIFLLLNLTQLIEQFWKGSYFVFDFWPSVIFFGIFLGISWLWRPTETSYMLAVSQQVALDEQAQDGEHEFELDDLSVMSHLDDDRDSFELNNQSMPNENPPQYEHKSEPAPEPASTLFELGEDDDDDRLK